MSDDVIKKAERVENLLNNSYGFIGKQFVCHDYGTHSMIENGMTKRMRKADWRE